MTADPRVVEGKYLEDVLDQPRALQSTYEALDRPERLLELASRLGQGEFQRVVLTGMGGSFHGLHPLRLQLIDHGFTAVMVETSELIHHEARLFDPKILIIAVSQSGQSAETVRLFEVNRDRSPVIAVTNTPGSPLAERAAATLFTRAGREFSVSCKTYVTALMALKWVGDALCQRDAEQSRQEMAGAAAEVGAFLASWREHVIKLAGMLTDLEHLFLVGRGASLAAVGAGALVIKESDHFHAEGMSSAAFRHGPMEMLSRKTFVVVFSGDAQTADLNEGLLADIRQQGGRAELVAESAPLDCFRMAKNSASIRPILEILPVQMITLALAALTGREAGKFVIAQKITTTE